MSATTATPPSDRFRRFYAEVQAQRRRVGSGRSPRPAIAVSLDSARTPLLDLIRALEQDALDQPAADADAVRDETALMAVFADQVFSALAWDQAGAWRGASLERQLVGSDEGRDGILRRIDELLRTADPGRRGLGRMYLLALCLGPGGDDAEDERVLAGYRSRLLAFAVPGEPPGAGQPLELTPQACRHTGTAPGRGRIPALRPWVLAAVGSMLLVWAVSHVIWSGATRAVDDATSRILGAR